MSLLPSENLGRAGEGEWGEVRPSEDSGALQKTHCPARERGEREENI